MTASILVATPHAAFGELLRISLEDSGQYTVRLVLTAKEARAAASRSMFQLAIMDAALPDEPFVQLCYDLLASQAGMHLVVIPPENNPNHPSLGELIPHGYLSRPFYLPELLDTLSHLLNEHDSQQRQGSQPPPAAVSTYTLPPWLQEPLTLNAYLAKELAGTQALAGMVGIYGPNPGMGVVRASSGSMDDSAAAELASVVFRYWNSEEKADLMRFIRLSADKKDYLVYATQLVGDMVLILAYDTAAPLSQIRPQTKSMAQALAHLPPDGYHPQPVPQPARQMIVNPSQVETPDAKGNVPPNSAQSNAGAASVSGPSLNGGAPGNNGVAAADSPSTSTESQTQPLDDTHSFDRERRFTPVNLPDDVEDADADEEEASGPEPKVINLSALLGAIPSPDPQNGAVDSSSPALPMDLKMYVPPNPGELNASEPLDSAESAALDSGNWYPESEILSGMPQAEEQPAATEQPAADELPAVLPEEVDQPEAAVTTVEAPVEAEQPITPPAPPVVDLPAEFRSDLHISPPTEPPARPSHVEFNDEDFSESDDSVEDIASGLALFPPPMETRPVSRPAERPQKKTPAEAPRVEDSRISISDKEMDLDEAPIDPLEDTRPRIISTVTSLGQLEPSSPAVSLLNYTCVLVPRLPQHYLIGEVADKLAQWTAQLCLAFGWRLEGIAIRPEYLQWSAQVAPSVSPGNLVRIIRQRTSLYIFSNFPHLAQQNPSGDFWATGYLIVSGPQPPSAQLLRDYIAQTRKRQGINK